MQLAALAQDVTDVSAAVDPTDPNSLVDTSIVNSTVDVPALTPEQLGGTDTTTIDNTVNQSVAAASSGGTFDLSKFITSLAQGTATVATAVATGTAAVNTAVHGVPGTVSRLPNGGTMMVNADGSTTVTAPNGSKQTILTNGKVINGGAPLVGAMSNQTLLMLGAAALGALFFLRKA